jgi:transcriptional regulator with XRE-family HTH domain
MPPAPASLHPLTRYRQRHGLTLAAFGQRVPTTAATLSRIETGSRQPTVPLLRAIVAATHGELTADEIVNFRFSDGVVPRRRAPDERLCETEA